MSEVHNLTWRAVPVHLLTSDHRVLDLDWTTRGVLCGIFAVCDDYGRFTAHPRQLAQQVGWSDTPGKLAAILRRIAALGIVRLYEGGGRPLGEVVGYCGLVPRQRERQGYYPAPPDADTPEGTPALPPAVPLATPLAHPLPTPLAQGSTTEERSKKQETRAKKTSNTQPKHNPADLSGAGVREGLPTPEAGGRDTPEPPPAHTPEGTPDRGGYATPAGPPAHPPVPPPEQGVHTPPTAPPWQGVAAPPSPSPAHTPVPPPSQGVRHPQRVRGEPAPVSQALQQAMQQVTPPKPVDPRVRDAVQLWQASLAMVSPQTLIPDETIARLADEFGVDCFVAAVEEHITSDPKWLRSQPLGALRRRCEWAQQRAANAPAQAAAAPTRFQGKPKPAQGLINTMSAADMPPPDTEREDIFRAKAPHPEWMESVKAQLGFGEVRTWINPLAIVERDDRIELWGPDESHCEAVRAVAGDKIAKAAPRPVVYR